MTRAIRFAVVEAGKLAGQLELGMSARLLRGLSKQPSHVWSRMFFLDQRSCIISPCLRRLESASLMFPTERASTRLWNLIKYLVILE